MNSTIDDYYDSSVTNIRYTEGWKYGPNCTTCTIKPDVDKLFDRTWHEVTVFDTDPYPENLTIPFDGTAVLVFCVIPNFTNHSTGAISAVNVSFELDGVLQPNNYEHEPDGSSTFNYNVAVYNNTSLKPGHHTLVLTPQSVNGATYLAFDWATYSNQSSPLTLSSSTPISAIPTSTIPSPSATSTTSPAAHTAVGAIVGGVVGGILGVLVAVLIGLLLRRRARQRRRPRSLIEPDEKVSEVKKSVTDPFPLSSFSQTSGSNDSGPAPGGLRAVDGVYERTIHIRPAPSMETRSLSPSAMSSSTSPRTLHSQKASDASSALILSSPSTSPFPHTYSDQASRMSPIGSESSSQIAELSRQIRVLEQTVSDLRRRQSTDRRTTTTLLASNQPSMRGTIREDVELRQEIATLQHDVERLRSEQAMLLQEAPPAYEPREDENATSPQGDDTS